MHCGHLMTVGVIDGWYDGVDCFEDVTSGFGEGTDY